MEWEGNLIDDEPTILDVSSGNKIATDAGVFVGSRDFRIRLGDTTYYACVRQESILLDTRWLASIRKVFNSFDPSDIPASVRVAMCSPGIIMKATALLCREGYL